MPSDARVPRPLRRIPRTPAVAGAAVIGVAALAGCGIATSPREVVPEVYVAPPVVSPEAEQAFGAEEVRVAYDEVTWFALEHAFEEEYINPERIEYTVDDLSDDVQWHLSPAAATAWSGLVISALAGDTAAQDAVRALHFFRWNQPTWTLPADGTALERQHILDPEVTVVPATADVPVRLLVTFTHTATMEFRDQGTPFEIDVEKSMSYWLIPATADGNPQWWVDQYEGTFRVANVEV